VGKLVLRQPTNSRDDLSTPFRTTLAPLAAILGRSGPVLVICSTKVEAMRLANEIAELTLVANAAPIWLADLSSSRLGDDHPLTRCLRRGVAYHHASLPGDILLGIEEAMSADALRFVVATTTLTEGVNLPVRSVLVASQGAFGGANEYEEYITGARLLNAIGRAGRAARESEGWVVLARNANFMRADFERLRPTEADMPVRSVLGTDEALEELAALELLLAQAADVAMARPGRLLEGFVSYVWYLALLCESAGTAPTDDALLAFLESTLAWHQFDPESQARYLAIAREARDGYLRRPLHVRQRWGRAGTSIATASVLDEIAAALATVPDAGDGADIDVLQALLDVGGIDRLLALPEAQTAPIRRSRGGPSVQVPIDAGAVVYDWIRGIEVNALGELHLEAVPDANYRLEQMADFLTSACENFLPWAISTVITWANAARTDTLTDLPSTLPAFIRYGVDSSEAVSLVRAGIPSRSLATRIARSYLAERQVAETTVRSWLCTLDLNDWRDRYSPNPAELRALLEFARPPRARVAATLLAGEGVTLPFRALTPIADGVTAELRPLPDEADPPRLGYWVEGQVVGAVSPEHFAEIDAVRSTGIPIQVQVHIDDNGAVAHLRATQLE
jgi:hypothetical protein